MLEIDINLRPSQQFIALLFILMAINLCIIVYVFLPIWVKILLIIFNLGYGGYIFWRYGLLKHPRSIVQLSLDAIGYRLKDHLSSFRGDLCGESTITTWVCILRFNIPGQRWKRSCIVFKDAVDQETYRRLTIAVKVKPKSGSSTRTDSVQ